MVSWIRIRSHHSSCCFDDDSDDLDEIQALAPALLDALLYADSGTERDLRLALGSYVDIPEV